MLYDELKKIINPGMLKGIDEEKMCVELKEKLPEGRFQSVSIYGIDEKSLVIKADGSSGKFPYLNPNIRDIHKRCDYVIITKHGDKNIILFCELKSVRKAGAKRQLLYSIPFIDYLMSLFNIHIGEDISDFEKHFVIFSKKNLGKQRAKNNRLTSKEFKGISIKMAGSPKNINISKIIAKE